MEERGGRNDAAASRPIQPAVIYTDRLGNPLLQQQQQQPTNWPPAPANFSSGFMHADAPAAHMDRWRDVPFQCLLALTETASSIPTVPSWGGIDLNFDYGYQDPIPQHYGHSLPQGSMAESSLSLGFAPVTPQKAMLQSQQINGSLELAPAIATEEEVRVEGVQDLLCQETLINRADAVITPDENDGRNLESTPAASLTWANHNREKVDFSLIDLNKLPPLPTLKRKAKRKKHVPKVLVLVDGKPKKRKQPETTPKPPKKNSEKQGLPTEASSSRTAAFEMNDGVAFKEGTPRNIKKYSRRGVSKTITGIDSAGVQEANNTPPPGEATGESADPQRPPPAKRSCRRELSFDLEEEPAGQSYAPSCLSPKRVTRSQSASIEVKMQKTSAGAPYDFNSSVNEMLRSYSSKAGEASGSVDKHSSLAESATGFCTGLSSYSTLPWALIPVCRKKRTKKSQNSSVSGAPVHSASKKVITSTATRVFPAAEKAISNAATASINYLTYAHCAGNGLPVSPNGSSLRYKLHNFSPLYETEMLSTKRRSRAPVRVRDLASLISIPPLTAQIATTCGNRHIQNFDRLDRGLASHASIPPLQTGQIPTTFGNRHMQNLNRLDRDLASLAGIPLQTTGQIPTTCGNRHIQNLSSFDMRMEALVADGKATLDALVTGGGKETLKTAKISKRDSQTKYASSKVNDRRPQGIMVPLVQNKFLHPASGSVDILFNQFLHVDVLAEQLKHLNINRGNPKIACAQRNQLVPYNAGKQKQNAMVIYTGDDRIIPFQPPKKKRPRAKVELNEETLRVFNLLLKDIDSEGIDGTDEAKKKYWEDERKIFRGRTDSFIARMHLVQGDRRFTRWKGSVVDSVVGVFLTQNVSDHLSSSAFMSMAARFPIKREETPCRDEGMHCVVANPIVSMPDEEAVNLDEMSNQSVSDRSSITLHDPQIEEAEVVHTIDSTRSMSSDTNFVPGEENYNELVISSQNSTVSSQNSNSPVSQTVDRKDSSSETNSRELDPTDAAQINSFNVVNSFLELLHMAQSGSSMPHEVPKFLHQSPNETAKTSTLGIPTQKESVEPKELADEPLKQFVGNVMQQPEQVANHSEVMFDIVESSREKENVSEKTTASNMINHPNSRVKGVKDIDAARRKAKSRRVGDEIKDADWEALRRSAKQSGKKNKRVENAKDSVDWEAVRCAGVNEIAETIKARGMNNMLAARIKEFLDKVLTYHGSVDLEWLRDVPPDRAKEYLLSFNGLGLKSVECVRLLTLHHLAFPVDTNVGRIAVRLGWVPLQPLPESLQLHLLEMYPILDTIQKYLWPRLCKLDQKTLYELHYQLITFGKVFCTKSKPNCNACPMRGECRHFASAFASARLSLPGPEEKRIVTATQERPPFPRPMMPNVQRCPPLLTICEQPNQPTISLLPSTSSALPSTSSAPEQEKQQLTLSSSVPEQGKQQSTSNPSVPEQGKQQSTSGSSMHEQEKRQPTPSSSVPEQENHHSVVTEQPVANLRVSHEPIIEEPLSPEPFILPDIEDFFYEDPDEIPVIKLNVEELAQNIETYLKQQNLDIRESDMSLDLVAMATEATYMPPPKLKNISRLRTEHQVYELPDRHRLLEKFDKREYDDPSPYLLAIWTPGETADSVSPPERRCTSQSNGRLCEEGTCPLCTSYLEAKRQIIRGTILIPCRTAMRGSFPLNGTYFQVNEVFADHESSLNPIEVPRSWLWNLPRRTVYFGTSVPTIFRGLTTEEIQQCFWRGFVCVRGFERETRAPRPLMARLHLPTSKLKPVILALCDHIVFSSPNTARHGRSLLHQSRILAYMLNYLDISSPN